MEEEKQEGGKRLRNVRRIRMREKVRGGKD